MDKALLNNDTKIYDYLLQYAAENIGAQHLSLSANKPNYLYLPSNQGSGYVVVHKLNDEITLSVVDIHLHKSLHTTQQQNLDSLLSVSFIIYGGIEVIAPNNKVRLINDGGEIWTQTGNTLLTASNIPIGIQKSLRIDIHSPRLYELLQLDYRQQAEFAGYKIKNCGHHFKNLCSQIIGFYASAQLTKRDLLNIESLVFNLLASWQASANITMVDAPNQRQRQAVEKSLKIISKKINQPLTIAYLASEVGINECYLKSAFKQLTGSSIASYIRKQRLACAYQLLLNSDLSIQQIAQKIGYCNSSHFSQNFRKQYQQNPSSIRKSIY